MLELLSRLVVDHDRVWDLMTDDGTRPSAKADPEVIYHWQAADCCEAVLADLRGPRYGVTTVKATPPPKLHVHTTHFVIYNRRMLRETVVRACLGRIPFQPIAMTPRGHRYHPTVRSHYSNDFVCMDCGAEGHFEYILDYVPCTRKA